MADMAYRKLYAMNREEARRELIKSYQQTGSIGETARRWHTSRRLVRKWLRRFEAEGEAGLQDRSHRPRSCPQQTSPEREQQVIRARQETGYGPLRLAPYLQRQGVSLPAGTIRHILKRHGPPARHDHVAMCSIRRSGPGRTTTPSP